MDKLFNVIISISVELRVDWRTFNLVEINLPRQDFQDASRQKEAFSGSNFKYEYFP